MTDAEYYRAKAAFEARRAGAVSVNIGFIFLLPFVWLIVMPYLALRLIYYIGGIFRVALSSMGRSVIMEYLSTSEHNNYQQNEGVSNESNLANGFNPDADSDWVGTSQVRRQERTLR